MLSTAIPFALLALVPVLVGPLPQPETTMIARLCNGGTITIPLGDDTPPVDENCHPKGCHAGTCRQKSDQDRPKPTN